MITVYDMINMIQDEDLRTKVIKLLEDLHPLMVKQPASADKHHKHMGGFVAHTQEVMNIALRIWKDMSKHGELTCTMDDVILCSFVHDLDKLWRYAKNNGSFSRAKKGVAGREKWYEPEFMYALDWPKIESSGVIASKCGEYGIKLTPQHIHAITFHHGGWSAMDKVPGPNNLSMLATILHAADILSAWILSEVVEYVPQVYGEMQAPSSE